MFLHLYYLKAKTMKILNYRVSIKLLIIWLHLAKFERSLWHFYVKEVL